TSIIAAVSAVPPNARTITAGAGLTGGGDLSANRTLDVVAGDTSLVVNADEVHVNTGVIATVASLAGYQPLDSDLTAVAGLGATGFLTRTGTGTMATRSFQYTAPISVNNNLGLAADPNISIANFMGSAPG